MFLVIWCSACWCLTKIVFKTSCAFDYWVSMFVGVLVFWTIWFLLVWFWVFLINYLVSIFLVFCVLIIWCVLFGVFDFDFYVFGVVG